MKKINQICLTLLFALTLTSCDTSSQSYIWLTGVQTDPNIVPPLETSFSLNLTGFTGDPSFIFSAIQSGTPISLYTVILNSEDPANTTAVQIREMSGSRSGRVVFYAMVNAGPDDNLTGHFKINPENNQVQLRFSYQGIVYQTSLNITNVLKINKTLYINSDLTSVANAPPTAVISPLTGATLLGQKMTFDGSQSSDPEGDSLTFAWTLRSSDGTTIPLEHSQTSTPQLNALSPGEYSLQLIVNDGQTDSLPSETTFTIAPDQKIESTQMSAGNSSNGCTGPTSPFGSRKPQSIQDYSSFGIWLFLLLPIGVILAFKRRKK